MDNPAYRLAMAEGRALNPVMNSVDSITKILVGLFIGTTAVFCGVFFYAVSQNASGAHYNIEDIKGVGQLVVQQILYFFSVHSGVNTQVPLISQMRNPKAPQREVNLVETSQSGHHPDNE